jgi:hypothetical protein
VSVQRGLIERAEAEYARASQAEPLTLPRYEALVVLHRHFGNAKDAERLFREGILIKPNDM